MSQYSRLNMSNYTLSIAQLNFEYSGASKSLFNDLNFSCNQGWTGLCGANGSGKSTLLRLITGELTPDQGVIHMPGLSVYCEQRTDLPPPGVSEFFEDYCAEACILRAKLQIEDDWLERWNTLSHGERKRIQIATALGSDFDVLLIDEPTNHLDANSTELLIQSLESFAGIGLIVTHDRALLDRLCCQCLWLDDGVSILRKGGYSVGMESASVDRQRKEQVFSQLKSEQSRLMQTASGYRVEASRAHKKRSNRGLAIKDHDGRARKDAARVSGKDGQDGQRLRQLEGRMKQLNQKVESIVIKKEYDMGIWMDFGVSSRNLVFSTQSLSLALNDERSLVLPRLEIRPVDKIVITGPNGAGKSSLLNYILQKHELQEHEILYLPQEITLIHAREILLQTKQLSKASLGQLMRIVRRLGSDPKRILHSDTPSPGELRKILLGLGILKKPMFLVIDEPTNHLDLPSIACLESALLESPCGYLLVSHDQQFVENLGKYKWDLVRENNDFRLIVT